MQNIYPTVRIIQAKKTTLINKKYSGRIENT